MAASFDGEVKVYVIVCLYIAHHHIDKASGPINVMKFWCVMDGTTDKTWKEVKFEIPSSLDKRKLILKRLSWFWTPKINSENYKNSFFESLPFFLVTRYQNFLWYVDSCRKFDWFFLPQFENSKIEITLSPVYIPGIGSNLLR